MPPGYNCSPFEFFAPAYHFSSTPTSAAVRQSCPAAPLHCSDAGLKSQARGSAMRPSLSPSIASHASIDARVSSASLAAGMIGAPSRAWVAIHEWRNPNVCRIRLFAGSPATMPS